MATKTRKIANTPTKKNGEIINRFKLMIDEMVDLFYDCKYNCITRFSDKKYRKQILEFIAKKPFIEWERSCEGYIPMCQKLTQKNEELTKFMLKYKSDTGLYNQLLNIYNNHNIVRAFRK